MNAPKTDAYALFSHPDFTVGIGISPIRQPKLLADYTAGREFHPAPKIAFFNMNFYNFIIQECSCFFNPYFSSSLRHY